jgi:hypothetical protein
VAPSDVPVTAVSGELGISRFPREVFPYVLGVFDRAGLRCTSRYHSTRELRVSEWIRWATESISSFAALIFAHFARCRLFTGSHALRISRPRIGKIIATKNTIPRNQFSHFRAE